MQEHLIGGIQLIGDRIAEHQAGDHVDLRAEMDTLVVLNTCPHPMDRATEWSPKTVELVIYKADPVAEDDLCMNNCPENQRGFANTAIYHCQY